MPKIESAFLAEDGAGNVGYTTDKGFLFISRRRWAPAADHDCSPDRPRRLDLGQPVPASYSCSDERRGRELHEPSGERANIDTSYFGQKTFR